LGFWVKGFKGLKGKKKKLKKPFNGF